MEAKIFLKGSSRPIFRKANQVRIVDFLQLADTKLNLEETMNKIGYSGSRDPLFVVSCNELDSIEVAETFRREEDESPDSNGSRRIRR